MYPFLPPLLLMIILELFGCVFKSKKTNILNTTYSEFFIAAIVTEPNTGLNMELGRYADYYRIESDQS